MQFKNMCRDEAFWERVVNGLEPETTLFYKEHDRLIWDLSSRWYASINRLSKGQYELEDIHNEVWAYVFKNLQKYNLERAGIPSWIYLVAESKLGMIKRTLEAKKNTVLKNEVNYSSTFTVNDESSMEFANMIISDCDTEEAIMLQEFLLDYIYVLLELIDSCTDKERRVYLLKIKGKSQQEIADEANVSISYVPKVYKRLSEKFRSLYDTLYDQCYIDKKERNALAKDLLNKISTEHICEKYDLEESTVDICKEMLNLIGV